MTTRTGTLKSFLIDRGFGFIRPTDRSSAPDVFFHVNNAPTIAEEDLRPGLQVVFNDATGRDGRPHAVNVARDPEADQVTRIN